MQPELTLAANLGRITGTTCRYLIAANSMIDWQEVLTIVWQGLITLVIMTFWAGQYTRKAWDQLIILSERMGKAYSSLLTNPTLAMQTEPIVHPLHTIADELNTLTVKQLQTMLNTRKRMRKAELVALACALA